MELFGNPASLQQYGSTSSFRGVGRKHRSDLDFAQVREGVFGPAQVSQAL